MRSLFRLSLALVGFVVFGATACGSTGKSYIPVDSPLRPWQAPENDEPTAAPPAAKAPAPAAPQAEKTAEKKAGSKK